MHKLVSEKYVAIDHKKQIVAIILLYCLWKTTHYIIFYCFIRYFDLFAKAFCYILLLRNTL